MNVQYTEKIESIFNNTLLLIKENGFHGTPMSQIAKQSDVAVGTIYHYFPSKEILIVELYHYCKKKVQNYLFDDLDQNLSYQDRFKLVFKRFCDFHIDEDVIFSFLDQYYSSPYFEIQNCKEKDGPYQENHIFGFLQEGINNNHLKKIDVHTLTSVYIGSAVSFSKSILYRHVKFEEKNLNELIETIWQGVKKEHEHEHEN